MNPRGSAKCQAPTISTAGIYRITESFRSIDFEVVFVTAYDQFAIKAFRCSPVDYLLKPIQKNELIDAVAKVTSRLEKNFSSGHLEILLDNVRRAHQPLPNLALPTMEGLEFIPVTDIIYCKSDSNYTHLVIGRGKAQTISRPLKVVEQMLADHPFMRVHQSYLVNLGHVRRYIKGQGGELIMSNGDYIAVSRAKKDALIKAVRPTIN